MRWGSYDDSYDALLKWVKDMEFALTSDVELKSTLSEKRNMLQLYRVSLACFFPLVSANGARASTETAIPVGRCPRVTICCGW